MGQAGEKVVCCCPRRDLGWATLLHRGERAKDQSRAREVTVTENRPDTRRSAGLWLTWLHVFLTQPCVVSASILPHALASWG